MQTLFEAASHIAQEIERTRQHLINLEQALEGLKPLITVDAATTTLTFSMSSQAQPIEDLSVVNAEESPKKKVKSTLAVKAKVEKPKAEKPKADKPKATKEVVVEPVPVAETVKLPATGAEFWLKCLGRKKATVAQLADSALKKLQLDESTKNVMAARAKAWAYSSVKKGDLIEAGMRDGSKLYQLAPVKDAVTDQSAQAAEPVVVAGFSPVAAAGSTT
ncbi:MAG: hypothetical protein IT506_04880 [Aquabacterium sp.]|nr:hypothetical protein [Aquabacterium sp.]